MFFSERLGAAVARRGPVCVGLDPHLAMLPRPLLSALPDRGDPGRWRREAAAVVRDWSLAVVEAVAPHCAVIKPQVAFYEALGAPGVAALEEAVAAARKARVLVLLDAKRADIGSTAEAYAAATLDDDGPLGADAVTVSPWLGPESLAPFLARSPAKGVFLLVRTSNPGSAFLQGGPDGPAGRLAEWMTARNGATGFGPLGAVVGATHRDEAAAWRRALPNAWLLVPGFGAQGATLEDVRALAVPGARGAGMLVNSSRAVLFPPAGADDGSDWAAAIGRRAAGFARDLASASAEW